MTVNVQTVRFNVSPLFTVAPHPTGAGPEQLPSGCVPAGNVRDRLRASSPRRGTACSSRQWPQTTPHRTWPPAGSCSRKHSTCQRHQGHPCASDVDRGGAVYDVPAPPPRIVLAQEFAGPQLRAITHSPSSRHPE